MYIDNRKMLATCDICGHTIECPVSSIEGLEFFVSKNGWTIKKIYDDVLYICPECIEFGV
jgi:Fe2+ or Zn2+ uptake regulation protein